MKQELTECTLRDDQVRKLSTVLDPDGDQPALSGREILLPLTGQAFMLGTLKPDIIQGREQVQISHAGSESKPELISVSTDDARAWLRQSQRAEESSESSRLRSKTKSESNESLAEPEIASQSQPKSPVTPHATMQSKPIYGTENQGDDSMGTSLSMPFVEIHEEFDESGNEISADAINVSDRLQAVWKTAEEKGPVSFSNEKLRAQSTKEPLTTGNNEPLGPEMTDEQYSKLSERLDELMRLEEEVDRELREQSRTPLSKKKLGSGWGKGFLNQTPKKKKSNSRRTTNTATIATESESSLGRQLKSKDIEKAESSKAISFGPNDVKEIPRVGNRSIREETTKHFDPKTFSGVINERDDSSAGLQRQPGPDRNSVVERPTTNINGLTNTNKYPVTAQKGLPKKRVSRFAQERAGLR